MKTLINKLKSNDKGFADYISFLIVLPILLIVIVGGSYIGQSIRVMSTIDHALQIVSDNMTQNGALTTQGQDQLIAYIEKSGLDPSKIYLNATTDPQSYGSRGLEATIGYDFDLKAPGSSGVIWHKYYEQSLPIAQSQLIPGSGADNSGSVNISSVFAGIQGGTTSGGSTSGSGASIQTTSLTMTSNNTSPTANASVMISGKAYIGSNTAPAGTQIALNGGGVRQTVSADSSGNYTANVAFSSQGSVTLQATSGVASASVTINVQPSVPTTITLQAPTTIQIGNSFNVLGKVVDASGSIVADDTVVTISSSNTADIPTTNIKTKYGSFSYTVTKITSLDSFTITAKAGSVSATESVDVIPGKPESVTLNASPPIVSAGSTVTFSGKVLGPYGTPPAKDTPVKIISGTNVVDTMPSGVTDDQGNFSMTATLTKAGSHVFYAQTTDSINSPTVTVAVTSSTPYKVNNLSQTPNPLNSGANLAISGSVSDQYDNPINSGTILITSSALPDNVSTVVQGGTFNTHVTMQTPGIQTLTVANSSANPLAGGSFTVAVLATSAFTLTPEQDLYTVKAGQSIGSVQFILKDSNGQPVAGKTVKFTETPQGDSLITPLTAVTDASGRVQTTVGTLIKAGTHTLMATLTDDPDVIGTVGITVNPGAPAIILSTVAPSKTEQWTAANPVPLPIISGTVTDSYANPINGASITVSGGYGASITGTSNGNGYYTLSVKPTNIGGPFTLSFAVTSICGNYNTIQSNLKVTAPLVVPVDKVLAGITIAGQTGTMTNRAGDTVSLASSISGTTLKLRASKGYRDGVDDNVTITDPNFIASNLIGTVFGLVGTAVAQTEPAGGSASWTTAGTYYWTVPAGVNRVLVGMHGAGGGGASACSGGAQGASGGGGAYRCAFVSVIPGSIITVVVGSGGAGGHNSSLDNPGSNGGPSSFGSVSSPGGGGAGGGSGGAAGVAGKASTASPYIVAFAGGAGIHSGYTLGAPGGGGAGAGGAGQPPTMDDISAVYYGGSGGVDATNPLIPGVAGGVGGKGADYYDTSSTGFPGAFPGGGGSGGDRTKTPTIYGKGGDGASGAVYIQW